MNNQELQAELLKIRRKAGNRRAGETRLNKTGGPSYPQGFSSHITPDRSPVPRRNPRLIRTIRSREPGLIKITLSRARDFSE